MILKKLFKKEIVLKVIGLTENEERHILSEMRKIDKISYWLDLQKQAGYELYAKTNDRKYLGYSEFAITLENIFLKKPEIEEDYSDDGYESSI